MMPGTPQTHDATVAQLASFCRGEMSAVETYDRALANAMMKSFELVLTQCRQSHAHRVSKLSDRIKQMGGSPPQSSGPWGALVKFFDNIAEGTHAHAVISILEDGEDHGSRDYEADIVKLDIDTQAFLRLHVIPHEVETRRLIESIKFSSPDGNR